MARTIDFDKVDAAFQHLASPAGTATLAGLDQAFNKVAHDVQPQLNTQEIKYLLTHLVNQKLFQPAAAAAVANPAERVVGHGFVIKTAVPE